VRVGFDVHKTSNPTRIPGGQQTRPRTSDPGHQRMTSRRPNRRPRSRSPVPTDHAPHVDPRRALSTTSARAPPQLPDPPRRTPAASWGTSFCTAYGTLRTEGKAMAVAGPMPIGT
jgi:hypothetical protein